MATMLYQPGIKVYIQTASYGVVDVSDDLTSGNLVRRSDGVSTFDFTIVNPRRMYDGKFSPNDRIVVLMKRITWMRVFTGLLNSVPLFSVWPRDVQLRASCSLKRLQYYYWDAFAPETESLLTKIQGQVSGKAEFNNDDGTGHIAQEVLYNVVGWPREKVHIGQVPTNWYNLAYKVAKDLTGPISQADIAVKDAMSKLTASYVGGDSGTTATDSSTVGGDTSAPATVNGHLVAGSYGGVNLTQDQVDNATTIYSVARGMGMSDRDGMLGIMCAMQESTLTNLHGGDRDSVGLFQQRPSCGWGTVAQCENPTYASTQFFKSLAKVSNRDSMTESAAIQAVQHSGFPDAYQKWLNLGKALSGRLNSMVSTTPPSRQGTGGPASQSVDGGPSSRAGSSSSSTSSTGTPVSSVSGTGAVGTTASAPAAKDAATGLPTGASMAEMANKLITTYKQWYSQATPRTLSYMLQTPPGPMDCSLWVSTLMARVLGGLPSTYPAGPVVHNMDAWAMAHGGKRISVEEGLKTAGAWMIIPAEHIGLSMGDGKGVAAEHTYGKLASVEPASWDNWAYAVLPPGFSFSQVAVPYTGSGGTTDGSSYSTTGSATGITPVPPTTVDWSTSSAYNKGNKFDQLFGSTQWSAQPYAADTGAVYLSSTLTGVRALMNDQPILPYIKNLMYTSMRSFCSAPNGDLIGWFPDYYGLFGQAAVLTIEPIELQDFTVEWSDDSMTTHQFVSVSQQGSVIFDIAQGGLSDPGILAREDSTGNQTDMRPYTAGIANIDMPSLLSAVFGIEADPASAKKFAQFVYNRFGARPTYEEMPGLVGPVQALFGAIFRFTQNWGYQYNADIPITFMPEAWPGMLVQIPEYGFQAYITTVTHSFNMAQGGGFNTTINISNPARLPSGPTKSGQPDVFIGLPEAGAQEGAELKAIQQGVTVGAGVSVGG